MKLEISTNYLLYIYGEFYKFFFGTIKDLSETNHHKEPNDHDGDIQLSKNHLEGDVWSHTCLVFKKFMEIMETRESLTINDLYACIAVLCHDLGKCNTRGENKGKITFYSHTFASIQYTIDFINYLSSKTYIGDYPYYYILNPISNHIDFLRCDFEKHKMYANYDSDLAYINCLLCYCDSNGRITTDNDNSDRIKEIVYTFNNRHNISAPENNNSDVEVILLCGVPGSGKNTFINKNYPNTPYISYDDIRIELYREHLNQLADETPEIEYRNAWKYCKREKKDLNSEVNKRFKRLIFEGHRQIIINNTNLTKRGRKAMMRLLGKNNYYKAIYVMRDRPSIFKSNYERIDKTLSVKDLIKFVNNQPIPTRQEGFDEIEFYNNCKQWEVSNER